MKKSSILFILFFYSLLFVKGQQIQPLHGNSILINHKSKNTSNTQRSMSVTGMSLPFFEDFSYAGPFPDPAKWDMSQTIFVNHTYPIAPPTIGVATFDGLGRNGYPYNIAAGTTSVLSDSLISQPIRLDSIPNIQALTPGDSIYLSFYYQAKGRGDLPEQNDELRLYFFKGGDSINFSSSTRWSHAGYNFGFNANDTNFHRVMIPVYRTIADTIYFKKGFRFAFRNLSAQSGAIDHWHIDQVYLNSGRSIKDTVFKDVSFVYDEQTLLKNYMQMPFNQFTGASDMKTNATAFIRNNNNVRSGSVWNGYVNVTTEFKIFDNLGTQVAITPTVGTNNVYNYDSIGYCNDPALINPSLGGYTYGSGPFPNSTSFLFKFYLFQNNNDTIHTNDTAFFRQDFNNYFAYDDGTAEAGYYVQAVGGETAVRYKLNADDTLRALDIFFDPVHDVNILLQDSIHLTVRADNNGSPGAPIFTDGSMWPFPVYSKNGYDVFQRYQLSKKIPLDSGTTFYVGVVQEFTTGLAIGFDRNTDTHTNDFYYLPPPNGNGWNVFASSPLLKGSLMIRPVFGDSLLALNIGNINPEKENIIIYPNPASDEIVIQSSRNISRIFISDLLGNVLLEEKNPGNKINVSSLPNGMYLVNTFSNNGTPSAQKLIITR